MQTNERPCPGFGPIFSAGAFILKSKGSVRLPRYHRASSAVQYSVRRRCSWIMSAVHRWRWSWRRKRRRVEGKERARWITRRGDLTGRTELCDHSKVLIISLTLPILPVMKENRWLRPGLRSPASPKAERGQGEEMNFERAANWFWQRDRPWHRFCSKADVVLIDYQYFKQSDENKH